MSMRPPRPAQLLDAMRAAMRRDGHDDSGPTKLGTVASTYSGGRPQVVFDGETTPSTRTFPYLASYTPAANDRVMLTRAGNTWVVVGKVV